MKQQERIHELELKIEELKTNMALMTDELEELRGIIDRMGDDSVSDSVTIKQLYQEVEFYTEAYNKLRKYPFQEGDTYYVLNHYDYTWIESVWDDESERIHDSPSIPSHPHRVYFTLDQKNIIDNLRKNLES